jgi:hypothetical protein
MENKKTVEQDSSENGALFGGINQLSYENHQAGNREWTGNSASNKPQAQKAINTKSWGNDGDRDISKGNTL